MENEKLDYRHYRQKGDEYIDKALSDIKKELAWIYNNNNVKVEEAPREMDIKKSTDALAIIESNVQKIAIRTRMAHQKFRDLTIRCETAAGCQTEIHKIQNADLYYYSWATEENDLEYVMLDVKKLVESNLIERYRRRMIRNKDQNGNYDGSGFIAIPLWELAMNGCIISYKLKDESLVDFSSFTDW